MGQKKRIVLAYSGGLDTSVILAWLRDHFPHSVITSFTADIGQEDDMDAARQKAIQAGIEDICIEDLKEEFVRDYVFPMMRANTLYEGEYLLGTAIARPLIARRLVEIAADRGAEAICHGATGKGNDQLRFEFGALALNPELEVIAPWRQWTMQSRQELLQYARQKGISIDEQREQNRPPYSMDANLLHISYEGGPLEDPWQSPDESMWRWTCAAEQAPETAISIVLRFQHGDAVALNGQQMSPAHLLKALNECGGAHGIGRADLVENRYIGMKSRGCYETPGGTILLKAHRAIESLTLDREAAHLKDELMPRYAQLIYNGYWWAPERQMLQRLIDDSQQRVNGEVRLRLYRGNVQLEGRRSASDSLYDAEIASFEDDNGSYNQQDAEGFIRLNTLRLRIAARKRAQS